MSQRLPASRPASPSPPDGQRITLPPVQLRDDAQQGGRQIERQQGQSEERGLPSQQNRPATFGAPRDDWRTAPPRDLGVRSMLNPAEPEGSSSSGRRLSATESPVTAVGPPIHFGASPSTSGAHAFPGRQLASSTSPTGEGYPASFPRGPRRILTPRSPSRAVSAGRGFGPATIDAQQSPFLSSRGRTYIAEPGRSEVPPMPTPPVLSHMQQYGFPPAATNQSIAPRRASANTMQGPGRTPISQNTSPSISASSNNQPSSQTSPASFLYRGGPPPPQSSSSYFPGSSFATSMQQSAGMQFAGPSGGSESQYNDPQTHGSSFHSSSAGSSRQTSASDPIPLLTMATSEGPIEIKVDMRQGSKMADEKRARNAGASARFRQRRKEKEREASSNIEKLQQQTRDLERRVREVEDERDFYRGERNRFRDVVYRTPEVRHLAMQSPPSPQSRRASFIQGSMSTAGNLPPPPPPPPPSRGFSPTEGGPGPERPPRRRRMDEYSGVPYSLPPASTLPPVQTGYTPQSRGPPSLPPLRMENSSVPQASTPASGPPGPPRPPLFESYSRGPPYMKPEWPDDNGQR